MEAILLLVLDWWSGGRVHRARMKQYMCEAMQPSEYGSQARESTNTHPDGRFTVFCRQLEHSRFEKADVCARANITTRHMHALEYLVLAVAP